MLNPATAERREQILGDLAEGLAVAAKEAQRRLMEAADNEEFVRMSGALCNLARGVRQCLGVHARLERDRRSAGQATARSVSHTRFAEAQDRKARIGRAMGRRLHDASPDQDNDNFDANERFNQRLERLDERLDDLAEDDDFLDVDPDALIAQLCEEFGLAAPEARAARAPDAPAPARRAQDPAAQRQDRAPDADRGQDPPPTDSS